MRGDVAADGREVVGFVDRHVCKLLVEGRLQRDVYGVVHVYSTGNRVSESVWHLYDVYQCKALNQTLTLTL